MQAVLLRVGIDTGSGGIHGPLFKDGTFEFIPIVDGFAGSGVSDRTYGNTVGRRYKRKLIDYFPEKLRERRRETPIHDDPEFGTFTYGDPTRPKAGLRKLKKGDLLIFYAGLQGWNFLCDPALYIIGFFEVEKAGLAVEFSRGKLRRDFEKNFHVRHKRVFEDQKERLVLVKGGLRSRLLRKAERISMPGMDSAGRPIHVLSSRMQNVFGDFQGHISIHRSPPRKILPEFASRAERFVRSLR